MVSNDHGVSIEDGAYNIKYKFKVIIIESLKFLHAVERYL